MQGHQWRNVVTTAQVQAIMTGPSQWRKAEVYEHFIVPFPFFFMSVTAIAATPPSPGRIFCLYHLKLGNCQGRSLTTAAATPLSPGRIFCLYHFRFSLTAAATPPSPRRLFRNYFI